MPSLEGKSKMSSTNESKSTHSTIYTTDTPQQIRGKINKYAYSGGQATIQEHRQYGANIDVDISCQYLKYFMEDDQELARIIHMYKIGELLSGEVKEILAKLIIDFITAHQNRKNMISDDLISQFYQSKQFI